MKIAPVLALPLALLAIGCSPDGLLSPLKGSTEYRLTVDTLVQIGPRNFCADGHLPECAVEGAFIRGTISVDSWEKRSAGADLTTSCPTWAEPECTYHLHLRAPGEPFPWFGQEEPLRLEFDSLVLAGHEVEGGAIEGELLWIQTRGPGGVSYRAAFRMEPV